MREFMVWVRFFYGTPRRFLATTIIGSFLAVVAVATFSPQLAEQWVTNVAPSIGLMLGIAISVVCVWIGLKLALKCFLR